MKDITEISAEKIRDIAVAENVPILGTGPTAAMANEPQGYRPEDLLPGARSLICFGIPVPRGVYLPAPFGAEIIWRSQSLYYRRLDTLSIRFAALLEESGEQAVPVFGCMPLFFNGTRLLDVTGCLNQLRMAEATGIGTIGRNGLVLHSQYGSRLMLGGVVTTAVLPVFRKPDTTEPGCPPNCRICMDTCPVQAISATGKRVDRNRCLAYTNRTPLLPKLRFLMLRAFRPRAAARLMNVTSLDEHTFHVCSQCVADCPYGEGTSRSNECS